MTNENTFHKFYRVSNDFEYYKVHLTIINLLLGDRALSNLEIEVISFLFSNGIEEESMYIGSFTNSLKERFGLSKSSFSNFKRRLKDKGFLTDYGKLSSDLLPNANNKQSYFFMIKKDYE